MKIEDFSFNGSGSGFENGKKVFIPFACKGDVLDWKRVKENSKAIEGEIIEIKHSSQFRKKPECVYYEKCGGCNLQHVSRETYIDFKINKIAQSISFAGFKVDKESIEFHEIQYEERRRARFKVCDKKLAFSKKNNSELVKIDLCLLLNNNINISIAKVNNLLKLLNYNFLEVEITEFQNGLELILIGRELSLSKKMIKHISLFTKSNDNKFVSSYYKYKNSIEPIHIKENSKINIKNNFCIQAPASVFLQASKVANDFICEKIFNELSADYRVLDLYCGIGIYSFYIYDLVKSVHSVEGDKAMLNSIKNNCLNNNIKNVSRETRDLVNNPLAEFELNKYDFIIINPPRNGSGVQCERIAKSQVSKLFIISCNPSSLSRDLKILKSGNYIIKNIWAVDQFYASEHIETLIYLEKIII